MRCDPGNVGPTSQFPLTQIALEQVLKGSSSKERQMGRKGALLEGAVSGLMALIRQLFLQEEAGDVPVSVFSLTAAACEVPMKCRDY